MLPAFFLYPFFLLESLNCPFSICLLRHTLACSVISNILCDNKCQEQLLLVYFHYYCTMLLKLVKLIFDIKYSFYKCLPSCLSFDSMKFDFPFFSKSLQGVSKRAVFLFKFSFARNAKILWNLTRYTTASYIWRWNIFTGLSILWRVSSVVALNFLSSFERNSSYIYFANFVNFFLGVLANSMRS